MANKSKPQQKRSPYQFLKSTVELRLKHAETRRMHEDKTLFEVTKAIYALETSLIPRVGPERMKEFIESYRERGRQAIATLEAANERLESMVEENDVLAIYGVDDVDEMIAGLGTRDGEEAKVNYERTAGGQNDVLEALRLLDRACCMVEALTQQGCIEPIERYETIQGYTQTVRQYIRKIQRIFMKANDMADRKTGQEEKATVTQTTEQEKGDEASQEDDRTLPGSDDSPTDHASASEAVSDVDKSETSSESSDDQAGLRESSEEVENDSASPGSRETSKTAI